MGVSRNIVETLSTHHWSNVEVAVDKDRCMSLKTDSYISDQEELQEVIDFLTEKKDELKKREAE